MEKESKSLIIKKKLLIEGLFALFITLSPLLFYYYTFVPASDSMETWSILGIKFSKNGYESIYIAFYFYLNKIIPLYLLVFWFITCKHWWYHAILVPIAMYSFQLYAIFNADSSQIDENELYYLLIVCMVIIPVVYFVRLRLFDKHVHGIDLEAMDEELKILREKQNVKNSHKTTKSKSDKHTDEYQTLSEKIDQKLSTDNLESIFRQLQNQLNKWLHLRF